MTGNRVIYCCAKCKKDMLEYHEVVNLGNFNEDKWFFTYLVPKRYRLNFYLCLSCFTKFKKIIKEFMENDKT